MHLALLKVVLILTMLRKLRGEKLLKQTTSSDAVSLPEGAHGHHRLTIVSDGCSVRFPVVLAVC